MRALVRHLNRIVRFDAPLEDAPEAYEMFQKKQDGMIKAMFHP